MKAILALMIMIILSACSNENVTVQQNGGKGIPQNPPAINEQTDIQDINRNSNLIRKQTESTFRSINPDSPQSVNPLTSAQPADKPRSD